MRLLDRHQFQLREGVLPEPDLTDGRLVVWLAGRRESAFRHWQRIATVPGAAITVEHGLGATARYVHLPERMLAFGPDPGMPHTRAMGKGLFELRLKGKEGIGRVFFCHRPKRRIVTLHAFVKKSAKTPAKELKSARERLKEVQANEDA